MNANIRDIFKFVAIFNVNFAVLFSKMKHDMNHFVNTAKADAAMRRSVNIYKSQKNACKMARFMPKHLHFTRKIANI
ncbi:MAG: hypothetical protein ACI4UL_08945, partial [Muribaculaceae bacterium]